MNTRGAAPLRRAGIRLMEAARRTDALDCLPALLRSQFDAPEQLAARQAAALRTHLEFCRDHVPYYGGLFADLGIRAGDPIAADTLPRLPVLTKAMIREAGDAMLSDRFATLSPRPKATSGSTGIPLNYHLDRESHSCLWAHIWRAWDCAGYRPGDVYATLSGGALLPEKVDLKQRIYLLLSGAIHLPSYHLTEEIMDRYAAILERRRVRFMYGYPSSLELFASHLASRGRRVGSMDAIFTTSEVLTPAARATIESGLDGPVHDTYGCNDGGLYGFECAQHRGLHQNMESCVAEVVDDAGRPLPDGEVGLIVTTHLANKAHPFLRYSTGDLGAVDRKACACGRGLLRITSLQGRERDIVTTATGRRVHGAFFNHFEPFYRAEWLERYQVYQRDRGHLEIRMKVKRPPNAEECGHIVTMLKSGLDGIDVDLKLVEEFELTATGKFRVVISNAV